MENDDNSWWHQQDLELQQQEEQERIERCNAALSELTSIINEELTKVGYERTIKN